MPHVLRTKYKIDRRRFNLRFDQMSREKAVEKLEKVSVLEDETAMNLCVKKLGLGKDEFEKLMKLPTKAFRDYKTITLE